MWRLNLGIPAAALLLAACAADEHADLKAFVTGSNDDLRGHIADPKQTKAPEMVIYQSFHPADPFSAKRMRPSEAQSDGVTWTPPGRREPLEAYPLDALHMVGSTERSGGRWAVIKRQEQGDTH